MVSSSSLAFGQSSGSSYTLLVSGFHTRWNGATSECGAVYSSVVRCAQQQHSQSRSRSARAHPTTHAHARAQGAGSVNTAGIAFPPSAIHADSGAQTRRQDTGRRLGAACGGSEARRTLSGLGACWIRPTLASSEAAASTPTNASTERPCRMSPAVSAQELQRLGVRGGEGRAGNTGACGRRAGSIPSSRTGCAPGRPALPPSIGAAPRRMRLYSTH